ncbi:hypothetical protein GQ55_7G338100 [Panicum hallii var. hallii]|uniref:GIR1-like zinc ribbon domain-containing protein n=1 Tax=Panicum hallii var. hallii TaxID=1504633 RepID=A0A2T7D202_9POAL|nr:hypothetical protein GQ55_7G338100 [Panicum hallii var. hallii]
MSGEKQGRRSSMSGSAAESSSPASSCVSSDAEDELVVVRAAKPMVVVGCPQCLMYVMLSGEEAQPKCPRCKSPVLLHFLRADADDASNNNKTKLPAAATRR